MHPLQEDYLRLLHVSQATLSKQPTQSTPYITDELFTALVEYHGVCERESQTIFDRILRALSPKSLAETSAFIAGQWPRRTWGSFVEMLSREHRVNLSDEWLQVLLTAAFSFLRYQQARRLLCLFLAGPSHYSDLRRELQNNHLDHQLFVRSPDWLLLQIDNNFLARPVQMQIAQEMVDPSNGSNSLLQLNMGEGKSSVIIPLAAASLADGHQLVRVIILKSLATQMFQLLVERLTKLVNRRIFYLPFSREVKINSDNIRTIHELYKTCRDEGGILITQPEHILSFTLMTMDMVLSSSTDSVLANAILTSEEFVKTNSRDLVDESDEIFHPRYALIYTLGQQQPLQGHPYRWRIIMRLFSLAANHILALKNDFPEQVDVEDRGNGAFPKLSISSDARLVGEILISRIANDGIDGKLSEVHFRALSSAAKQRIKTFISVKNISCGDANSLRQELDPDGTWDNVLILRGMLACGVLVYSLQKRRWRVDYGLDLQRSLLAVPYRAKDLPSLRSEFGHPDVAIALTCLSYYYEGLMVTDMSNCLNSLFQQDNPALEYESWIHGVDVPSAIRDVNGINMEDSHQLRSIVWPTFHVNLHVVNFFMDRFVFPKAAKDFPHKLPSSGWDLAEEKVHPTTGFSGTNDNRYLIPTSIHQIDRDEQLGTNALVLNYLLQEENKYCVCLNVGRSSESLLQDVVDQVPEVRAFLDVGAQMLELRNEELARRWLELKPDPEVKAAVYFNDHDELTVMTREGIVERLATSPFDKRLDQCLVYLDDAHTRGTDLKLPLNTRAAVTLGRKVAKDRLVQGCMRLRQLGHGQSVLFLAPPDIDRRIRELANKSTDGQVDVEDVLLWAMTETWDDIEHHAPLWAQQGFDHRQRKEAINSVVLDIQGNKATAGWIRRVRRSWVQPEARSLEELYFSPSPVCSFSNEDILAIPEFKERLDLIGTRNVVGLNMGEEQEREVSHEIEMERQQEKPHSAKPATHSVHPHLPILVYNGSFSSTSPAFVPLFDVLQTIPHYSPDFKWSDRLFATRDFATTVSPATANQSDYLKPVRWILSLPSSGGPILIVLSPYEVNELLPSIRRSTVVNLHLYCPRVIKGMPDFECLNLHTIHPEGAPVLRSPSLTQLHLFAGQLYLPDEDVYAQLCDFLGLSRAVNSNFVQADGFVKPADRRSEPSMQRVCRFKKSPVPFLKELTGLRRKGNSYMQTHMGQILAGRVVATKQFS